MTDRVVYEIARYDGWDDDAEQVEIHQLVLADGVLKLRDANGVETLCGGLDALAVISSTPALCEIIEEQEARIGCVPEILTELPFLLEPVANDENAIDFSVMVNGARWSGFRTQDEDIVMLPGWSPEDDPEMNPCWAELQVGEGEYNPLIGWTSIGLCVPGIAIEYARYDHGGWGPQKAVSIRKLDDFATVFADWLLDIAVLQHIWGGDSSPYSPDVALFEAAANAADQKASWRTAAPEADEDNEEDDEYERPDHSGWMHLRLHLSDQLIEEVRTELKKRGKRQTQT